MAPTRRQVMLGGIAVMAMKSVTTPFSQFLRLAFFRSPNYVAGVSGWTINQDGSAEFNNITIRNGQIISGVFLLYSGNPPAKGNLVLAFAPIAGGTDSVGNVYPQGFNFGVWNASGVLVQHFGIDQNGKLYLADTTGTTRIFLDPSLTAELLYDSSGISAGHLKTSIAAAGGTDTAGNAFPIGVASFGTGITAQMDAGGVNIGSNAQIAGTGGAAPGRLLGTAGGGMTTVSAGKTAAGDVDSAFSVLSKNGNGGVAAIANVGAPLVFSIQAAGTPAGEGAPLLYADNAAGALSCVETSGLAGRVVVGGKTQVTTITVTATTGSLGSFTIEAKDAEAGSVYEIWLDGNGNVGATPAATQFGCTVDGATQGVSRGIAAAAMVANQAFRWSARVCLTIRTAGAGGTAVVSGTWWGEQTANDNVPGTAADWGVSCAFGVSATFAFDTTVSHTLGLQVVTGGTLAISSISGHLKKVA